VLTIKVCTNYLGEQQSRKLATDEQESGSRRICHGLTRKNTEKTEAETRKENQAQAFATEFHGIKTLIDLGW
jgi:hypothetical protein